MAGLQTYSQVVTPEPSPAPSPAPTPGASRAVSPMATDPPPPDPVRFETAPNQFGFFCRFTQWPTVDPEMDITIDDLIDTPTFTNTSDRGYRNPDDSFDPSGSSNLFAPYLNATVYHLMNWFYQTGAKMLTNLDSLVHDVILAPDFSSDHLDDFSASSEAK